MVRKATSRKAGTRRKKTPKQTRLSLSGLLRRSVLSLFLAIVAWVGLYALVPPPTTPYILSEGLAHGSIRRSWVPADEIAPEMLRATVAAEDANFCLHWGFDMGQLRAAIAEGGNRGASTLTQQTVKNVWLWHGRSWPRKALEAMFTPVVEAMWSKRRILEVYLNMAEFDTGVFGIEAAAQHHFGVSAAALTGRQAALLAAVLPNPKERQAVVPSTATRRRAAQIADGAATIDRDGRAACFQ
ncbi:MAG: monofunctional biosynthetic peptidoglycan transglycosylase [Silicimonas sp.]|jgi:monofunctional biosynthetic peptidoglycan transglycosylase|nr:monofunctional biosynthetic peptidoglycan transglycosylase [Silicimonas sp.]